MNLVGKILSSLAVSGVGSGVIIGAVLLNKSDHQTIDNVVSDSSREADSKTKDVSENESNRVLEEKELSLKDSPDLKHEQEIIPPAELSSQKDLRNVRSVAELHESKEETTEGKEKRYDLERKIKNISLEVFWYSGEAGYCFLSKKDKENEIPNIMNLDDEDTEKSCYHNDGFNYETEWSNEKSLDGNEEVFWVRGENEKIKELFNKNWGKDGLLELSGFVKKDMNKDVISNSPFKDLVSDICTVTEKDEKTWTEISCIRKETSRNNIRR